MATSVGDNSKSLDVQGFSFEVLSIAVDFMYGIEIPKSFNKNDDFKSLLHLADMYLMGNLKNAAGSLLARSLNNENICEVSLLADKYRAEELRNKCVDYIFHNANSIDDAKLGVLTDGTVMASLAKRFVLEAKKKEFGSREADEVQPGMPEDPGHRIFYNVVYLGSVVVFNPKHEAVIQRHMSVMNQESANPLSVTVSVPRSSNDSVVLRESATRVRVASFRVQRIIFFARGEASTKEKSCFAFTAAHGETSVVQCHVFRCEAPEAVNKIFVGFAKAFKKPKEDKP